MIQGENVVTTQKLKKGKKVGKPVFGGFRFQFNMPVSISGRRSSLIRRQRSTGKRSRARS